MVKAVRSPQRPRKLSASLWDPAETPKGAHGNSGDQYEPTAISYGSTRPSAVFHGLPWPFAGILTGTHWKKRYFPRVPAVVQRIPTRTLGGIHGKPRGQVGIGRGTRGDPRLSHPPLWTSHESSRLSRKFLREPAGTHGKPWARFRNRHGFRSREVYPRATARWRPQQVRRA